MGNPTVSLRLSPALSVSIFLIVSLRNKRNNSRMSDTLFLLDMLRLANQEKMRAKKDEKIHDMAMEQKRRMEGAKKSGTSNFSASTGGFVGIDQLTSCESF